MRLLSGPKKKQPHKESHGVDPKRDQQPGVIPVTPVALGRQPEPEHQREQRNGQEVALAEPGKRPEKGSELRRISARPRPNGDQVEHHVAADPQDRKQHMQPE
jgi:hypothetical protein